MTRKKIVLFSFMTALSFLSGCFLMSSKFGPGYIVSLNIDDKEALSSDDITELEKLIKREQFNKVKEVVRPSDKEIAVYYNLELQGSVFDEICCKFIDLIIVYTNQGKGGTDRSLKYIEIMNIYAGYREPLKKELDRIARLFEEALKERIGAGFVHVERARTGPPM